jgi:uncharacterized protein (DUF302 family)
MFKKVVLGSVALSLASSLLFAGDAVRFNVAQGDKEEAFNELVNEKIEDIGFILSDPHERINDAYVKKYGGTNLDNLGFFSVANDEVLRELLIKAPQLGGFSPFNLHIYKKQKEDKTYVGHLDPKVMLDIVGVEDKAIRSTFSESFKPLDELVQKSIGGKVEYVGSDKLPEKPMMKFTIKFDRSKYDELSDYIDEFQENFEGVFQDNSYIIAGYKNFKEAYEDMEADFSKYDAFFVYSLCHFKFSEGIFNQGRPDAGVFAPCSMYMYIEKDSDTMHVGMPKLANWATVMDIKDQKKIDSINALDAEIIKIMTGLGAIQEGSSAKAATTSTKSDAKAAEKVAATTVVATVATKSVNADEAVKSLNEKTKALLDEKGEVSAYFTGAAMSVDGAKKALESNGFEVLTTYNIDKKGKYVSVVFTNDMLKKVSNKPTRGFASILRVLVDNENKKISVTNPKYFLKAFLQDDYNEKDAQALSDTLAKTFGSLDLTADALEADNLDGYHFMIGMPYYEDMEVVAEGKCSDLIAKAEKYTKKKKGKEGVVFNLKLADDRYILGVKVGSKTSKFPKKIGYANSQLLPYTVLVEKGEAKILAPKYFIAISYPELAMSEFMNIATIPGAINKDITKMFK